MLTGDSKFRLQADGTLLPECRDLQWTIFLKRSFEIPDFRNYHVNQMLQFIAHDITHMVPDDRLGKHIVIN